MGCMDEKDMETNIYSFSRLPETKDRTFEELDVLFEKRVPARKFASTNVDLDTIAEVEHKY